MSSILPVWTLSLLLALSASMVEANPFLVKRGEVTGAAPSSTVSSGAVVGFSMAAAGCILAVAVGGLVLHRRRQHAAAAHSPKSLDGGISVSGGRSKPEDAAIAPRSNSDRLHFIHAVKTIPAPLVPRPAYVSEALAEPEVEQTIRPHRPLGVPLAPVPRRTDRPLWVDSPTASNHGGDDHEVVEEEEDDVYVEDSDDEMHESIVDEVYDASEYGEADTDLYEIALGAEMADWEGARDKAAPI